MQAQIPDSNDRGLAWPARLAAFVTSYAKPLLCCMALVTIASAAVLPSLRFDASVERLTAQDHPAADKLREAKQLFGNDDLVVVAQIGDGSALEPGRLDRLRALARAVGAVPGVEHVWSPAGESSIDGVEQLRRNPLYQGQLLSRDGRTAALLVFPQDRPDDPFHRQRLVSGLRRTIASYPGPERIVASGSFVVSEDIGSMMHGDILRFSAYTTLLLAVILWLVFRSGRVVVLCLSVAGFATLTLFGLVTILAGSISVLATMIPSLILGIGTTYAIYFLECYAWADGDGPTRIRIALGEIGLPVLVSSLTTMAGFAALATTGIAAIREFMILGVVGDAFVAIGVLVLLPAGITVLPPPLKRRPERERSGAMRLFLTLMERFTLSHPRAVVAGTAVLFVLGCAGTMQLQVDTSFVGWLAKDHPSSRDFDELTERLSGLVPLYIVLDSGRPDGTLEPEFLARIADLQSYLQSLPHVDQSLSLVDLLKEVNRNVHTASARPDEHYTVPPSRGLVSLCLRRYAAGAGGSDLDRLDRLVSADRRWINVWLRTDLRGSREAARTIELIRDYLRTEMPGTDFYVTGTPQLLYLSADEVVRGQVQGLFMAGLSIGVTMMVMLRSLRLGLIAIPTNMLPVFLLFGVMGWFGIPLNLSTMLLATVTLGVVVDDTVHFIVHYRHRIESGSDPVTAIRETFEVVGRALVLTSVALSAAFLVLTLSSFRPVIDLGWLAGFTFMTGVLMDLLLLPILLRRFASASTAAAQSTAQYLQATASAPEVLRAGAGVSFRGLQRSD